MQTESATSLFKVKLELSNPILFILLLIILIILLSFLLSQVITDIGETIFKRFVLFIQFILMIFVTSMVTVFWAEYIVIEQKFLLILLNLVAGFLFFTYLEYLKENFQ